jgi:hypothetical protein
MEVVRILSFVECLGNHNFYSYFNQMFSLTCISEIIYFFTSEITYSDVLPLDQYIHHVPFDSIMRLINLIVKTNLYIVNKLSYSNI